MQSEKDVNHAVEKYADMVWRVCFYHLKNRADTEDVFQNVFLKYMLNEKPFQNEEHEKSWLLRVSINACKDYLKNFFRRNVVSIDTLREIRAELPEEHREVLEALLALPVKYKDVLYLHYYEGYAATEIADIMHKPVNTVYTMLARARKLLKEKLGGDEVE